MTPNSARPIPCNVPRIESVFDVPRFCSNSADTIERNKSQVALSVYRRHLDRNELPSCPDRAWSCSILIRAMLTVRREPDRRATVNSGIRARNRHEPLNIIKIGKAAHIRAAKFTMNRRTVWACHPVWLRISFSVVPSGRHSKVRS